MTAPEEAAPANGAHPPAAPGAGSGTPARRRGWTRWVRIAVGLALLGLLFARVDLGQLSVRWSSLLVLGAAACVLLLGAAQGLSALRWRVLLGAESPPWAYLFRLYLTAAFFSLFLPTAVGGDAVRATAASRSLGRPSLVVGTVLADRMLGVLALVVFFVIGIGVAGGASGLALGWRPTASQALLVGVGAVAAMGLAFALRRWLARPIAFARGIVGAFVEVAREPRRLIAAIALGLAVQGVYVTAWIVLARVLGLPLPLASFLVTVPLVSLSTMAPITLSGVGVREGAWILLLEPYGVPAADALALSLIYFGCWMVVAAIGGLWFAARGTELKTA